MPKVAASFDDQQHADAVVNELGRMNIDGLDWRVHQPGDAATGTVPVVGVPANTGVQGWVRQGAAPLLRHRYSAPAQVTWMAAMGTKMTTCDRLATAVQSLSWWMHLRAQKTQFRMFSAATVLRT